MMGNLGIHFAPAFWGFMAAFSEGIGGLLLIVGLLVRPAAAMLVFTMFVAALMHMNLPPENSASGLKGAKYAIEMGIVFLALVFTGAGRFSLDRLLFCRKKPEPSQGDDEPQAS